MNYDRTVSATATDSHQVSASQAHLPSAKPEWRLGGQLLDEVVLQEVIGQGGMGIVYRGSHVVTRQEFAIKRVRSELPSSRDGLKLFYRELVNWLDIPSHPYILRCLFFRTIGHELAIFADYMPGGSLSARMTSGGRLFVADVVRAGTQAAQALAALHSRGLIHQDVKPGNLLLDGAGTIRLADFGLARAAQVIQHSESNSSTPLATWNGMTRAYCSPEQARRESLSAATDVFSWGATMVHMLVGKVAWQFGPDLVGKTDELFLRSSEEISPATRRIIEASLHPDPARRPSMKAVAEELAGGTIELFPQLEATNAQSRSGRTGLSHEYQRQLTLNRVLVGPIYWELRSSLDLGEHERTNEPEAATARAQLANDIADYLRIGSLYRVAAASRPELSGSLQKILTETALAQAEAGDFDAAEDNIREAVSLPSEVGKIEAALAGGRIFRSKHRPKQAIEMLLPIAQEARPGSDQSYFELLVDLANAYSDIRAFSDARKWYERCLELIKGEPPSNYHQLRTARIHHELAVVYKMEGNLAAALKELDHSIQGFETGALASQSQLLASSLYLRGVVYSLQGQHLDAIETYDRAIKCVDLATTSFGDSQDLEAIHARIRLSRCISLASIGRQGEALVDIDKVIEIRRTWYASEGRSEFADELARAHYNKAMILKRTGDTSGVLSNYSQAYALYKQVYEGGHRDVRSEMAMLVGNLGEVFFQLGDKPEAKKSAREYFGIAVALTEELLSDGGIDGSEVTKTLSTLVTRYFQLSYLTDGLPDPLGTQEILLDQTMKIATNCLEREAGVEVATRFIEAATHKALMLHERGDQFGADKISEDATGLYRALVEAKPPWLSNGELVSAFLTCAGSQALRHEAEPQRALRVMDDALHLIPPGDALDGYGLARLAATWMARSRICRTACPGDVLESAKKAFKFWESAASRSDVPTFLSSATYLVGEFIDWCRRTGKPEMACLGVQEMLVIIGAAAAKSRRADIQEMQSAWQAHYSDLLQQSNVPKRPILMGGILKRLLIPRSK